jgi:hypothetical protein
MNLADLLGIDEVAARNLAAAYEGYAQVRIRNRLKKSTPREGDYRFPFNLRAGYFSRAASYWLLVEPARARHCYDMAAGCLHDFLLRIPKLTVASGTAHLNALAARAFQFAALAGNPERTNLPISLLELTLPTNANPDVFAVIISAGVAITGKDGRASPTILMGQNREMLARYSGIQAGSLGVPLRLYAELLNIISQPKADDAVAAVISWIERVSERIVDRMIANQADKFHWQHLYSPTLPFGTDILGLFIGCESFARRQPQRREWEIFSRRISPATKGYLEAARTLLQNEAAQGEDEKPN